MPVLLPVRLSLKSLNFCARSRGLHRALKVDAATVPGALIDDYERHRQRWLDAGGIWITHVSAKTTCAWLTELGIV